MSGGSFPPPRLSPASDPSTGAMCIWGVSPGTLLGRAAPSRRARLRKPPGLDDGGASGTPARLPWPLALFARGSRGGGGCPAPGRDVQASVLVPSPGVIGPREPSGGSFEMAFRSRRKHPWKPAAVVARRMARWKARRADASSREGGFASVPGGVLVPSGPLPPRRRGTPRTVFSLARNVSATARGKRRQLKANTSTSSRSIGAARGARRGGRER